MIILKTEVKLSKKCFYVRIITRFFEKDFATICIESSPYVRKYSYSTYFGIDLLRFNLYFIFYAMKPYKQTNVFLILPVFRQFKNQIIIFFINQLFLYKQIKFNNIKNLRISLNLLSLNGRSTFLFLDDLNRKIKKKSQKLN